MKNRKWQASLLIAALACVPLIALAGNTNKIEGKPSFQPKKDGAFIWHNKKGFHLMVTTMGEKHHYTGQICGTDPVTVSNLKKIDKKDNVYMGDNNLCVHFSLRNAGGKDGFKFNTASKELKVTIKRDEKDLSTELIHLGKQGAHPAENPFTVTVE